MIASTLEEIKKIPNILISTSKLKIRNNLIKAHIVMINTFDLTKMINYILSIGAPKLKKL